jgi:hypothetical protein
MDLANTDTVMLFTNKKLHNREVKGEKNFFMCLESKKSIIYFKAFLEGRLLEYDWVD